MTQLDAYLREVERDFKTFIAQNNSASLMYGSKLHDPISKDGDTLKELKSLLLSVVKHAYELGKKEA